MAVALPSSDGLVAAAQTPKRDILATKGNLTEVPLFVLNNKMVKARGIDPAEREAIERAYTRRIVRTASPL